MDVLTQSASPPSSVTLVGAGLAGSEAAWQLARRGVPVRLIEMRPVRQTPAHKTEHCAELVCSNSFKSDRAEAAHGILKEELRRLDSLVIGCADRFAVPAGDALAVDRERFSAAVSEALSAHPLITLVREEITALEALAAVGPVLVATGPLTSDALAQEVARLTGREHLYFYDAIAPVFSADSLDYDKVFRANRYGRGSTEGDYLNCPLNEEEYFAFVREIAAGEKVLPHAFEEPRYFEGCMPVEVMVERGERTLSFGPMKPKGLIDPRTGREPYAAIQLRQENLEGTAFGMVGFQSRLKWPEQKRIFRTVPGLEGAEFLKYGSIHRNTFIDSPNLLDDALRLRKLPNVRFAGQVAGVEGYGESTACGALCAALIADEVAGRAPMLPPPETALGALCAHMTGAFALPGRDFQPSSLNFGLFPKLPGRKVKKRERNARVAARARDAFGEWLRARGETDAVPPAPPESEDTVSEAASVKMSAAQSG